ncbi:MAG: S53 family peptidase [Burkholderiales bacterium]
MTSTSPAYNSGWATEAALDVQWAHATAPMARIVLIEAVDPTQNSLLGAIKLANSMGNGIVSMSFGASEGSWTTSVDSVFTGSNMTYLAATGDSGAAVNWPAVSPNVVAVGGTTLTYSGTGTRSEVSWSGTGGGTSTFTPTPSYQTSAVPGLAPSGRRSVADVAFNADPSTGQYVATIAPGSTSVSWLSAGGTSLSTPQWAGLIAVANATRVLSGKPSLGAPHSVLYGQIGAVAGNYVSAFADITRGTDGACSTCTAKAGYDTLSGLGTPNVSNLLAILSGVSVPTPAPVVNAATINGQVGTALSFTVSVSASNLVSYTLAGAPGGMSISSSGVVTWAAPAAGTYALTIVAKDTKTGLSGQGVYTITIAAQQPPMVGSATVTGKPGSALSFAVTINATNPVTYAITGAPTGLTISSSGVINWGSPILGAYTLTVIAKDTKTGLSGQGVYTLKIANAGPVITAPAISGLAGRALSGAISIADPGATSLSITMSGAPLGMGFSLSGQSIGFVWNSPVAGTYSLTISVVDSAGLTAKAVMPIVIAAK